MSIVATAPLAKTASVEHAAEKRLSRFVFLRA
jgi:hypothetical protein